MKHIVHWTRLFDHKYSSIGTSSFDNKTILMCGLGGSAVHKPLVGMESCLDGKTCLELSEVGRTSVAA